MGEMVLGYDAHEGYQGELDYNALKAKGGKFIIIKAGEGWYDYSSQDYVKLAKDNGLLTGTYWYYRQTIPSSSGGTIWCEPKRQALEYWKATQGNQDFPPALDIEKYNNPYLNPDHILICLEEIERLFGRKPIIYTGKYVWQDNVGSPSWSNNYDLWIAQYRATELLSLPKPFTKWKIHQFSDQIKVSGTTIDHNYFNGSEQDLLDYIGGDATLPELPELPEVPEPSTHVEILVDQLWGRSAPIYESRTHSVITRKGEIYEKAGNPEIEKASGITWQPIRIPERIVFVSASKEYIKEVL